MNKRIKQIRKDERINLSQEAFGKRIGVTGAAISKIESGDRGITDQVIIAIVQAFGVNEEWLRTGKGNPFAELSEYEKLSAFVGDVLAEKPGFRYRLISVLSRMTPEEWALLENKIKEISDEIEKASP